MAHELEVKKNGEARMFYAGKAPWHGLGTAVQKEVTAAAALKLSDLEWEVEKRTLYLPGSALVDNIPVVGSEVLTHKAVVRIEDGLVLGVVGKDYEIIQNEEAFGFLDTLVGEGLAMFHTAGSLFGGRRVFVSCKLPDPVQVGPDQIDKYLVAIWGHDGSMAYHIKWTPIRVVCWNTASAAFSIAGGKVRATDCMTIRHTANWRDRTDEARQMLDLTNVYYSRLEECFNRLIRMPFQDSDFSQYSKKLYPDVEKPNGKKLDRSKTRDKLRELFHHGRGLDHPDVKGTRWAAWNAVTEFIDHTKRYYPGTRGDVSDSRMNSVIWGQGSQIKKNALDLLTL